MEYGSWWSKFSHVILCNRSVMFYLVPTCLIQLLCLIAPTTTTAVGTLSPQQLRRYEFRPQSTYTWPTNEQPRFQWNANSGYCGETSVQTALMRYGAWMSVFDIREVIAVVQPKLVDPTKTTTQQQQLLLGENDQATAAAVNMLYEEYSATSNPLNPAGNSDTTLFLAWMKKQIRAGYSVSFGVFTASGKPGAAGGQSTYDHIISMANIQSNYNDDLYHTDDILCFNDWYGGPSTDGTTFTCATTGTTNLCTPYCYSFSDKTFVTSRTSCDGGCIPWCLPDASNPGKHQFPPSTSYPPYAFRMSFMYIQTPYIFH